MITVKETGNLNKSIPRLLGAAFLLQAIASAVSGLILLNPLIVPGDITATMSNIADHPTQMRACIVVEMVTVIGIIMLASLLYITLKSQGRTIALIALGIRLVEAALLAAGKIPTFSLLRISQQSATAGHPADLQTLGSLFYDTQTYAYALDMVFFTLGATLFYYLFFRSGYIPRWLSLLGLVAAPLAFIGTIGDLFGLTVPIYFFIPNLPFELLIGLWLLIKGIKPDQEMK